MKKDRNAFFQESGYFNQTNIPTPNMNIANGPFTTSSQSSFYAGPTPMNYNTPNNMNANMSNMPNYDYSDIESRLSKLERQINRLDAQRNRYNHQYVYGLIRPLFYFLQIYFLISVNNFSPRFHL